MIPDAIGKKLWVVPGGHIPLHSTGPEPAFTSHDKISLLNTGPQEASVHLTIYYTDKEPVGPYKCVVAAQRVRKLRINDLIDPLPVFLDTPYALVIRADVPVVVAFSRQCTAQESCALASSMAFAAGQL